MWVVGLLDEGALVLEVNELQLFLLGMDDLLLTDDNGQNVLFREMGGYLGILDDPVHGGEVLIGDQLAHLSYLGLLLTDQTLLLLQTHVLLLQTHVLLLHF